jgi:RHS repeat-associated protein
MPHRLRYAYDNNGNTLTDPAGKQYTWDFENRLVQAVVPGTGTTTFKYDPFGRRIQKSGQLGTTNYLYDGDNDSVIGEVDNNGNIVARYTHGLGIDQPFAELRSGATSYYQADGLGSATSLSNLAGVLANTYTYDSFGKLTASTGTIINPFQYTAREFDSETGIYSYRARYYDTSVGRFISEDPSGFAGDGNFYAYTANNPVLYIDPSGLVRYNHGPPRTVPVGGDTAIALQCLENCLKCITNNPALNLLVTGGAELTGHTRNSFHYWGQAVDISYWNNLQGKDVFKCAAHCGFHAGGDEPAKSHWHLQLYPGNGSQPLPLTDHSGIICNTCKAPPIRLTWPGTPTAR